MNYTKNYQINQWDAADRVLWEDFNEDNRKIEEALKELRAAIPKPDIAVGTYLGTNDTNSQNHILLGFKPSAVLISVASTSMGENSVLVTPDASIAFDKQPMVQITDSGFLVATIFYSGSILTPHMNAARRYCYVAFR